MNYIKNVLLKGLILTSAIYQIYAVLNLLIIHEVQKIDNFIILLVKHNPCQCQKILAPHLDCLPKLSS